MGGGGGVAVFMSKLRQLDLPCLASSSLKFPSLVISKIASKSHMRSHEIM